MITNVIGYLSNYLPDGKYKGKWGGYEIALENGEKVHTEYGIRTIDYPVLVIIKDGRVLEIEDDK